MKPTPTRGDMKADVGWHSRQRVMCSLLLATYSTLEHLRKCPPNWGYYKFLPASIRKDEVEMTRTVCWALVEIEADTEWPALGNPTLVLLSALGSPLKHHIACDTDKSLEHPMTD